MLIHATILMKLENVMLNERSQTQKAIYVGIHLYDLSRRGESLETESRLVVVRGWAGRGWGGGEWRGQEVTD